MKIHKEETCNIKGCVATLGSFDGVHFGHRKILEKLKDKANDYGAESLVITLFPHPRKVLNLDVSKLNILNTLREKEYLLGGCEVDHLLEIDFTKEFSMLSGEDFVKKYLVDILKVKAVVVGYDHHFGSDKKSGYDFLNSMGKVYGFDVFEVAKHDVDDLHTSSTAIREALNGGDVKMSNLLLVEPYLIITNITDGKTVVIEDDMKLIPPSGEYIVEILNKSVVRVVKLHIDALKNISIKSDKEFYGECFIKFIE